MMRAIGILFGLLLLATACGDDDDGDAAASTTTAGETTAPDTSATETSTGETTVAETTAAPATTEAEMGETVAVTGVEYAFEGVSDEVAVGTTFEFSNEGGEVHEMLLFEVPDEFADLSLEEILALPEDEQPDGDPLGGVMAVPGQESMPVDWLPGGGSLTVTEPGRYALLCFVPVGATLELVEPYLPGGELEGEEPPLDGPPHAAEGMFAEFVVTQ